MYYELKCPEDWFNELINNRELSRTEALIIKLESRKALNAAIIAIEIKKKHLKKD